MTLFLGCNNDGTIDPTEQSPIADDSDDVNLPSKEDDEDDEHIEYPYVNAVGLVIFDGDDILTDSEPVYSFVPNMKAVLNPGSSCQMKIEKHKHYGNDIKGAWELNLNTYDINLFANSSCFNQAMEIIASDMLRQNSPLPNRTWKVELIPPSDSPYRIVKYKPEYDDDITIYEEISTDYWNEYNGSLYQGSIFVLPETLYENPNYGVKPKKIKFIFNNVILGYYDNNIKKAVRLVGEVEIITHK